MSEFSESYHIKSNDKNDGIQLLKRAGLKGFVFAADNGWVTILPEGGMCAINQNFVEANNGVLLYYMHAEDHGWMFSLFDGRQQVSSFSCEWSDELCVTEPFDKPTFDRVMGDVLDVLNEEVLDSLFNLQDLNELFDVSPAYLFAETIGLKHYKWLSYSYIQKDKERGEGLFDEVEFVS